MKPLNRILFVEDEPDIQVIGRLALEAVGHFDVEVCGSGEQALRQLRAGVPDLVLLDVMMPDLDGPSTLRALRARPELARLPVIFMTAKAQPEEVRAYRELGAIGVISKPFDPMQLADKVRNFWAEYHANVEH
jgi:CheY-like chemotaxis protein